MVRRETETAYRNLGFVNMLFEKKMIKKKYKGRLEITNINRISC